MRTAPAVTVELDKALIVVALALLLLLGWLTGAPMFEPFGRGRLTYLTVLALPILVVALLLRRSSGGLRGMVESWWPVVGVLSVYESLKHMHANRITEWLGIRPKDELMLALDERLFGKALPLYMDSWTAPWFQSLMSFCYIWVYYLGPFLLLATAYVLGRRDLFRRLRLGLVLGLLGGYVLYILVPVAGPLFLIGDQFHHAIPTQSRLETLVFDTLRFNWDCFPSLHTAIPWLLTALVWRRFPRWVVALAALLASSVTLSTVALRFHYGIDLVAAFAWVGLVWFAVEKLERFDHGRFRFGKRRDRRREGASRSPARDLVRTAGWGMALAGAAASLPLVALERWAAAWVQAPSLSSGGVTAGAFAGLALGLTLFGRGARLRAPLLAATLAALALAAWLALLGVDSETLSLRSWSATWFGLLGPRVGGPLGFPIAAFSAFLPALLLGCALAMTCEAIRRLGIPAPFVAAAAPALIGAASGLLLQTLWLAPVAGYGAEILAAALAAVVAALAWRRAARVARPEAPDHAMAQRAAQAGAAIAFGAGCLLGPLVPLWTHLWPASLGGASSGFAATVSLLAGGIALAAGRPWAARLRPRTRSAGLLLVAAWTSMVVALWTRVPALLAWLAPGSSAGLSLERLRGAFALFLLGSLGLAIGLALPAAISGAGRGRGDERFALFCGGAALGCLFGALLVLPALGSQAMALLSPVGLALLAWASARRDEAARRPRLLGALTLVALLAAVTSAWPAISAAVGRHLDPARGLPPPEAIRWSGEDPVVGLAATLGRSHGSDRDLVALGNGLVYLRRPATAELALSALGAALVEGRGRALVVGPHVVASEALIRSGFASVELVEPSPWLLATSRRLVGEPPAIGSRSRVIAGSARGLLATTAPYDLVLCPLEDFGVGLARMQLSREFYALAAERLTGSGAFLQSLRLATLGPHELGAVVAAFHEAFAGTELWIHRDLAILVGRTPTRPERAHREARFAGLEEDPELGPLIAAGLPQTPLLGELEIDRWMTVLPTPPSSDRAGLLALRAPDLRQVEGLAPLNLRLLERIARIAPGPTEPPTPGD